MLNLISAILFAVMALTATPQQSLGSSLVAATQSSVIGVHLPFHQINHHSSATGPTVPPSTAILGFKGEPCHATTYADGPIYPWKIPPSCYAGIYWPNPVNYPREPGYGWCNWWAEVLHPWENIFTTARHATPRLGAAIYFLPGVQGASSVGHWGGEVLWISPDSHWVLISEMNDSWRGGGFARVNYRYVQVEPGVSFVY